MYVSIVILSEPGNTCNLATAEDLLFSGLLPAVEDWSGYAGSAALELQSTTSFADGYASASSYFTLGTQLAGDTGSYSVSLPGHWQDLINAWELLATPTSTITSNYIPLLNPVPDGPGYYSLAYQVDGDGVVTGKRLYGATGHRAYINTILVTMDYYISDTNTFPVFNDIWDVNY